MPLPPARLVALVVLGAALAALSADGALPAQQRSFVRLRGVVRDATNGAPIPRATVLLRDSNGSGSAPSLREITLISDANGRFSLPALTGASVEIVASADGYLEGRYGQMWPQDTAEPSAR